MRLLVLGIVSLLLFPAAVHSMTANELVEKLLKCADMSQSEFRLRCYDAVAADMRLRTDKKHTAPSSDFGLPPKPSTDPADFGLPLGLTTKEAEPAISGIYSKVSQWAAKPNGSAIFFLENGQIWQQIDGDKTNLRSLGDDEVLHVRIESGIFGGFNLKIEGRNGIVKVRRVK